MFYPIFKVKSEVPSGLKPVAMAWPWAGGRQCVVSVDGAQVVQGLIGRPEAGPPEDAGHSGHLDVPSYKRTMLISQ